MGTVRYPQFRASVNVSIALYLGNKRMEKENEKKEEGVLSPIQLGDLQKPDGSPAGVSDETFSRLLKETGGKSVIILSLTNHIGGNIPVPIRNFNVSAVGVEMGFVAGVLGFISDALLGKIGGTIVVKKVLGGLKT